MNLSKIIVSSLLVFGLNAGQTLAESHGNNYVHSRTNNGQFYVMYQTHMSLYVYENDTIGVSNCNDSCAENWPPALFDADTPMGENYSLIQRSDGTLQAAFKGLPLYLSKLDKKIGDTNGDGVDDLWFLARPDLM